MERSGKGHVMPPVPSNTREINACSSFGEAKSVLRRGSGSVRLSGSATKFLNRLRNPAHEIFFYFALRETLVRPLWNGQPSRQL
jgi:hypothetical protein